jgi:hypothetical protein
MKASLFKRPKTKAVAAFAVTLDTTIPRTHARTSVLWTTHLVGYYLTTVRARRIFVTEAISTVLFERSLLADSKVPNFQTAADDNERQAHSADSRLACSSSDNQKPHQIISL